MVLIPVRGPHCQSDQVIKGGKTQAGQQRYKCLNVNCPRYSLQRDLAYQDLSAEVKAQIIDMALSGRGIRDTARVLKISPTTVISELKKKLSLSRVNHRLLAWLNPNEVAVVIRLAEAAEVDALWS